MRFLYYEYYKKQGRGYTDEEMIAACEKMAGISLSDIFNYVYSTAEMDYFYYFNLLGINMDSNYNLSVKPDITKTQKEIINDLFRE